MGFTVEKGTIVLMVGAPGSGKSHIAKNCFDPKDILSSDKFREMLSGDENNQAVSGAAFRLLQEVAAHRARYNVTTEIDATNTKKGDRAPYLTYAFDYHRPTIAIVVQAPYEVCVERDSIRTRTVGPDVIKKFHDRMPNIITDLIMEVDKVYLVDEWGLILRVFESTPVEVK